MTQQEKQQAMMVLKTLDKSTLVQLSIVDHKEQYITEHLLTANEAYDEILFLDEVERYDVEISVNS